MKLRRSRLAPKGRIEIIPMIDVMFFLLATFMLASLSMHHLHGLPVTLPRGHAEVARTETPLTMTITRDARVQVEDVTVPLDRLASELRPRLVGDDPSLVVRADEAAPHGLVTRAMLAARAAGVEHFLVAVDHAP
ncbi:MAG: biopolymer transporter ExbD [bacterium]|nr:biopolymer transporter ExbD [bacterium]